MRYVFPVLSFFLYIVFMLLDITQMGNSAPVKFLSVILCLIAALKNPSSRDGHIVALAMTFTVAADLFLLVLNQYYFFGVLLFLAVQIIYCIRLAFLRGSFKYKLLPLRFLPIILLCLIDKLIAVSLLYFVNLCCNTIEAWNLNKRLIFAVGLTLFIGCDICVGAYNLGLFPAFTRIGMWMFYLPSQVCIVLSAWENAR